MSSTIFRLSRNSITDLNNLFIHCFKDDPYYSKMFPNKNKRQKQMEAKLFDTIEFCVYNGGAYGIYEGNSLVAFLLYFDYQETKQRFNHIFNKIFGAREKDDLVDLPYKKEIHDKIDILGENILYILSMGVHEDFRRKHYASDLIDFTINNNSNDYIVSDISNKSSLPIYEKREFAISEINTGYYSIKRNPSKPLKSTFFNGEFKLALPDKEIISEISKNNVVEEILLNGYEKDKTFGLYYFVKNPIKSCKAYIVTITYHDLLNYQRLINISHYSEEYLLYDEKENYLLYHLVKPYDSEVLWNTELKEMIVTRREEWGIIPDIQVLFPIEYKDIKQLKEKRFQFDRNISAFLRYLDFRTHFEAGVPKTDDIFNESFDFKKRIKRFYLGKIKVKITHEITPDSFGVVGEMIGQPAYVDLIVSIDIKSSCGVVSIVSLSTPFLISHFMDNIIRNQLFVSEKGIDDDWVNLYDYLLNKFSIIKRGTPKIYTTIPQKKDKINNSKIAALLVGETIYGSDEDLGEFCDESVLEIVKSKNGMGQYNRAFVCVHTNVFIQWCEKSKATIKSRMCEEAITYFYIELLMFEESAIQIANNSIISLLSNKKNISINKFLRKTFAIYDDFSKTVEFWDIQVNYPSSKESLLMLRKAFKINEQIEYMERNKRQLQAVFETQRDIMDRIESSILNYIILFLTLLQGVSIIAPKLFSEGYMQTKNSFIGTGIVLLIMIVYCLFKKIITRRRK